MEISVGTNSWVTLAYADDYMDGKFNNDNWASLSSTQKESALITAFYWILDSGKFDVSASSTSDRLKRGQVEAAWYVVNYWQAHEKHQALFAQGVKSFSLSRFSESLQGVTFPPQVMGALEAYIQGEGGYFGTVERDY